MEPSPTFDERARVEILLREYDGLRSEITSRISDRWAITGYVVAAVGLVAALSEYSAMAVIVIALAAALGLLGLWAACWMLIKRAALRILEIEGYVNAIVGEELLVWETRLAAGRNKSWHVKPWKPQRERAQS